MLEQFGGSPAARGMPRLAAWGMPKLERSDQPTSRASRRIGRRFVRRSDESLRAKRRSRIAEDSAFTARAGGCQRLSEATTRSQNGGMAPRGLHHAAVFVSDLERSIAFYRDVFGLSVAERFRFGNEDIAFMHIGSQRLELIHAGGGARPTGVVDHVAFEVSDLESVIETLRQHEVRLVDNAPVPVAELNARIFFCLGPDGERIELIAPDTDSGAR
jgi:lactoylglutathione lyase